MKRLVLFAFILGLTVPAVAQLSYTSDKYHSLTR